MPNLPVIRASAPRGMKLDTAISPKNSRQDFSTGTQDATARLAIVIAAINGFRLSATDM
jgi:hypothetical protein